MVDHQLLNAENQAQRERLRSFLSSLADEQLLCRLPNGWTVAMTLVHMAFWDGRISTLFRRLVNEGVPPTSIDGDAVNEPLAIVAEAIPPREAVRLALEAADKVDQDVANLPKAVVDQFMREGRERFIRRSLHRMYHLEKIEKALKS